MSEEKALVPRSEDFSAWYNGIVQRSELAGHSPVRGCMVIRPHGYAIWELMQQALDTRFKETGHQNAYFPLFVPESFLKKEADHVEGFAPEIALVTHGGGKKLEEPLVVRPTSEAIIWPIMADWIQSYRDLPMLINQWANIVRWEMRTRPFLRTLEFLWQEGHTAHASEAEAIEEMNRMLGVYADFAQNVMALPVVRGAKTPGERFAGALETLTIEAMMQDGKALQAATSHDLGQNFAKAFDVTFQAADGRRDHVWATSWGMSTRIIGALIMTHSDDNGLVLPPRIAQRKAVIVPIWKNDTEKVQVLEVAQRLAADLRPSHGRIHVDDRDKMRPGWKYSEWEAKGVPVRVEIGPRDLAAGQVTLAARHDRQKQTVKLAEVAPALEQELTRIQDDLFQAALRRREQMTYRIDSWNDFVDLFQGKGGFAWCHWCGDDDVEKQIQEETGATIRNIPLDREEETGKCVHSGRPSPGRVVFAQAY